MKFLLTGLGCYPLEQIHGFSIIKVVSVVILIMSIRGCYLVMVILWQQAVLTFSTCKFVEEENANEKNTIVFKLDVVCKRKQERVTNGSGSTSDPNFEITDCMSAFLEDDLFS